MVTRASSEARQRAVTRGLSSAYTRVETRVQELLDAANALIDERGSADFTIQDVLDRSQQTTHGFYQCFASKDDLLLALFEDAVREQASELQEVVDREREPLARLRAFTVRLYEMCEGGEAPRALEQSTLRPLTEFAVHMSTVDFRRVEAAMEPVNRLLLELLDDAAAASVVRVADTSRAAVLVKQLVMYSWFRNRTVDEDQRLTADEIWDFCRHGLGT